MGGYGVRRPKDRDYVETVEGLLFCLVGYLHPPTGYTAYLKYVPRAGGKWSRGNIRYHRALSYYHVTEVEGTFEYLRKHYPEYLFHCPVRDITISTVPRERVKQYYVPEERLQEIMEEAKDELEEQVQRLIELLSDLSGVPTRSFGVTGSILLKTHNPLFSDIDLTVLGTEASLRIKEALSEEKKRSSSPIRSPTVEKREKWIQERTERFPLTREEAQLFLDRRWNYGYFEERYFSIHPVRLDDEIGEEYGEKTYRTLGVVEGSGTIASAKEALFLPAIYKVGEVDTQGMREFDIREVVSYEGLYSDMGQEGERVKFKGVVEGVENREGETYHQVLIGSTKLKGRDYIKPLV